MNNEEFERNIHFIVDQQAKFFSDIEALKEQQAGTQKHLDYITKLVGVIGEKTLENTASIEQLSIEVRATSAEVRALSAEVRQTTINVNGLARMMGQHIGDANGHVQLEAEE